MSKEFKVQVLNIPDTLTVEDIPILYEEINNYGDNFLSLMYDSFKFYAPKAEEIDISDFLSEEDLFDMSEEMESTKRKAMAIRMFAKTSIDNILLTHLLGEHNSTGELAYIVHDKKTMAISAASAYSYGSDATCSASYIRLIKCLKILRRFQ